jgi:hypothetical protein
MTGFTTNYQNDSQNGEFNDLYLDAQGNLTTTSGTDEIVETCSHEIWLIPNDWSFSTTLGIPWNTYLQSDQPSGNAIKSAITTAITSVNGVSRVQSITLTTNPITRELDIVPTISLGGTTATITV